MNWIRENKFMTGFIVIVVIAAGVLGYLLYDAYGTFSDVSDQYNAVADQKHQLESRVPYPDAANLRKYKAERDDILDATHELALNLSNMVLPVKEMTPSAFQDQLRDTINNLMAKSGQMGVQVPKDFAFDLTNYQVQPPAAAAAGPLGRQLVALNLVMNILINDHVDGIVSLTRPRLPQEGLLTPHAHGGGFGRRAGAAAATGEEHELVEKFPIDIQFSAGQAAFQKVLNDLAASADQFFITRTLVIGNSDPKPVAKSTETPAPAATAAPQDGATTSGTEGEVSYLKFLVGMEKLNVAMRIEMVSFNPPEKSTRKKAPGAHPGNH